MAAQSEDVLAKHNQYACEIYCLWNIHRRLVDEFYRKSLYNQDPESWIKDHDVQSCRYRILYFDEGYSDVFWPWVVNFSRELEKPLIKELPVHPNVKDVYRREEFQQTRSTKCCPLLIRDWRLSEGSKEWKASDTDLIRKFFWRLYHFTKSLCELFDREGMYVDLSWKERLEEIGPRSSFQMPPVEEETLENKLLKYEHRTLFTSNNFLVQHRLPFPPDPPPECLKDTAKPSTEWQKFTQRRNHRLKAKKHPSPLV